MKVAVISLFREGFGGGSGRVAHDMARQFSRWHQVALICPADRTRQYTIPDGPRVLGIQSAGQGHACVPRLSRRNINTLFDFLDEFAPDVVHAHEPISLGLMGQVWAAMNNVPFVYTTHVLPTKSLDFGAAPVFGFLPQSWTEAMGRRMMSDFMRNCDAVIALNRSAADDIRDFGHRGTVLTIPNGRDVSRLRACRTADLHAPVKTLVFVGLINRRKNQAYLLEALQHLPRDAYRLQLIGDVLEADYGQQITHWARDQGIDNVTFVGSVPHAEIPSYLEGAHIFVSASTMEVQSLSVIEALASGTPVIGLSNETIDELVDERVGCALPRQASPAAFAQRIQALCSLPQPHYDQLCRDARARVAHLDWAQIQQQTAAAYAQLADRRRPRARSNDQILKIIERIPSRQVRAILTDRLTHWNETLRKTVRPRYRLGLVSRVTHANQISGRTWFYVGLTRVVSTFMGEWSNVDRVGI